VGQEEQSKRVWDKEREAERKRTYRERRGCGARGAGDPGLLGLHGVGDAFEGRTGSGGEQDVEGPSGFDFGFLRERGG
jgi:hypothetical protein